MTAMAENENTTSNPTPKSKSKGSASVSATVSTPTGSTTNVFEMPKFDLPKFEMPTAFREFAEKGLSMAKENYEKMKSAAEEATDVLEETYNTASKGCSGYGLKVLEAARTNTNATFDLFGELLTAKSYAEVVERSTAYLRQQFDTMTAQAKELVDEAQKVCTETAEPIKGSLSNAFSKA